MNKLSLEYAMILRLKEVVHYKRKAIMLIMKISLRKLMPLFASI